MEKNKLKISLFCGFFVKITRKTSEFNKFYVMKNKIEILVKIIVFYGVFEDIIAKT